MNVQDVAESQTVLELMDEAVDLAPKFLLQALPTVLQLMMQVC